MRILVPIDGSAHARRALQYAIKLSKLARGSKIELLNVQYFGFGIASPPRDWSRMSSLIAGRILKPAMALCRKARVSFNTRFESGPYGETIAKVANSTNVDLIVMGTRGRGAVAGLVLGSVAAKVILLAKIPVTLIK